MVSLLFACLPFWPSGGLTIPGGPLLLYAFLNILYSDSSKKDWLIIISLPFYSSFVLSNMFFLAILGTYFIVYSILKKQINFRFIFAGILFFIMSIIVDYRLFSLQFLDGFENNRNVVATFNFKQVIEATISYFLNGQYHFYSMHWPFIPLLGLLAIIFTNNKKDKFKIAVLILFALIISFSYASTRWTTYIYMAEKMHWPAIKMRFYSLAPFLWYTILGYAVFLLIKTNRVFKYIVAFCLIGMLLMSFIPVNRILQYDTHYTENSFFRTYFAKKSSEYLTFDEYYKIKLFDIISKEIPQGNYYIGCIGFQPEVAQFNNYNTVDGYVPFFSKADLKKFKKIINNTNEKWSCIRCYLPRHADSLNYDALKKVNCKYIFSKKMIQNNNLVNVKSFSLERDTIFVYEIQQSNP